MRQLSLRLLVVGLVALSSACALRSASVADLQQRPGRYQDRTVTVNGVVTDSWGVPLLPYKFYRVDDGTGQIAVLSQSTRNVPGRGDRVRVRGRVENVAVFGGRSVGLHLREEDLDFRR
jgi:DNA/RNA endonuclease YhcR with UshA esterase domain